MKTIARFCDNNAFYAFYLAALTLYLLQPNGPQAFKNTVDGYLAFVGIAILFSIVLSLVAHESLIETAGLKLSKLTLPLVLSVGLLMIFSNCFIFWADVTLGRHHYVLRPASLLFVTNRMFFVGTRTFVEELIFRGFLLLPFFVKSSKAFWLGNLSQAIFFTIIHAMMPSEYRYKITFILFIFAVSITYGWLNKTFSSLLPSWILHATNGVLISCILSPVN